MKIKLHEAIAKVLSYKGSMTVAEITDELNQNKWYKKGNNSLIKVGQVSGRIGNRRYAGMFNRDNGVISLKGQPSNTIVEGKPSMDKERSTYRKVTTSEIAKYPKFNKTSSLPIDITDAVEKRKERLVEHQEIVRLLALQHEKYEFQLFEGKFDCLATKGDLSLLYEIKTILEDISDQEKQIIKGVGQLKYYRFSIVEKEMKRSNIRELLVLSQKPQDNLIEFCVAENIAVVWRTGNTFRIINLKNKCDEDFNPDEL